MKKLLLFILILSAHFSIAQTVPMPEQPYRYGDEYGWGQDGVDQTRWWITEKDCTYMEMKIDTVTALADSAAGTWVYKTWKRKKFRFQPPLITAPVMLHFYGYEFPIEDYTYEDRIGEVDNNYSQGDTIWIRGKNIRNLASGTMRIDIFDWQDIKESLPLINITATKPVIIENCIFVNAGDMIHVRGLNSHVIIRNNIFVGLPPTINDFPHGRAVSVQYGKSVKIENNYLEQCRGFYIEDSEYDNILIRFNKAKNIDGRYNNASRQRLSNSPAAFAKIRNLKAASINIAWNEIINYPGQSAMHAVILISRVLTNSDWESVETINIDNNFIYGVWSFPSPEINADFDGAAIVVSGSENTKFVDARNNRIVAGRGIWLGNASNTMISNNRLLFSGLHPNEKEYKPQQLTFSITDAYQSNAIRDNTIEENLVQFNVGQIAVNDVQLTNKWTNVLINTTPSYYGNREKIGASLRDEKDEYIAWKYQAMVKNGYTIGPIKKRR